MRAEELRILILEDADTDAELCREELERVGLRFVLHRVDTRAAFEREIDGFQPDLILSDLDRKSVV